MSPSPITLDPRLLERLRLDDPPERWREIFGETGLLDVRPDDSPEGTRLAKILDLLRPAPARRRWSWVESVRSRRLGVVVLLILMTGLTLWMMSRGSGVFCFSLIMVAPLAGLGRDEAGGGPTEEAEWPARAAAIRGLMSALIEREFVLPMGDRLVESVPTLRTLQRLEREAEALEAKTRLRIEQILATAASIEVLDNRLGRPANVGTDEIRLLQEEAERARSELSRTLEAHQTIRAHRERVEAEVERWRWVAERRRLSSATGTLVGPEARAERRGELARLTGVTEVELLDLERRLGSGGA